MLLTKEKRIAYLGFDDRWFTIIGVLVISSATAYIFNDPLQVLTVPEKIFSWAISLIFTIVDWFINRGIMIYLRKRYPAFRDDVKRITFFVLGIMCTIIVVDFIGGNLLSLIPGVSYQGAFSRLKILLPIILITIMIMAIYEAIYYNIRLKKSVREEERSKRLLVQAQLDVLRNQAQPHFFFNTLNTLRDIIDQNDKEDAMEFVDKLSVMYRFLLETGTDNLIELKNELRFAKAYIYIQSERFGTNLKVNWDLPETSLQNMIVPMSLQLLLENAIKHNVISKAKPLTVLVTVHGKNLVVENKIATKSTQLPSTKLGLSNIQKRYRLITGKSIQIKNDGNRFAVSLPLINVTQENRKHANTDH